MFTIQKVYHSCVCGLVANKKTLSMRVHSTTCLHHRQTAALWHEFMLSTIKHVRDDKMLRIEIYENCFVVKSEKRKIYTRLVIKKNLTYLNIKFLLF